jgi:hypothetical protein
LRCGGSPSTASASAPSPFETRRVSAPNGSSASTKIDPARCGSAPLRIEAVAFAASCEQALVHTVAVDATGVVWVGTQDGLFRVSGVSRVSQKVERVQLPAAIGPIVRGLLWIGTNTRGVNRLERRRATPIVPDDGHQGVDFDTAALLGATAASLKLTDEQIERRCERLEITAGQPVTFVGRHWPRHASTRTTKCDDSRSAGSRRWRAKSPTPLPLSQGEGCTFCRGQRLTQHKTTGCEALTHHKASSHHEASTTRRASTGHEASTDLNRSTDHRASRSKSIC